MQFLQRWLPRVLVLAALGVVLAALFGDHKRAYGEVPLPRGGVVALPEGTTKVYLDEVAAAARAGDPRKLSGVLAFAVTPIGGGAELAKGPVAAVDPDRQLTERSQGIGSKDAVAELEVPAAGDYRVSGSYSGATASLSFGTDPFSAVVAEWRLWGGLLLAAALVSLLPRRRYRAKHDASAASAGGEDGQRAGSYESPGFSPYRG